MQNGAQNQRSSKARLALGRRAPIGVAVGLAMLWLGPALATATLPASPAAAAEAAAERGAAVLEGVTQAIDTVQVPPTLQPDFTVATATWLAVAVIFLALFRLRPLASGRNLDALVLAAIAVLLPLRPTGLDASWAEGGWVVLALTLAAGYWLVRGAYLLTRTTTPIYVSNLTGSASLVLVIVGVLLVSRALTTHPLPDAAEAGVVGAYELTAQDGLGALPYGRLAAFDQHPPLVYLAHVPSLALVAAFPPSAVEGDGSDSRFDLAIYQAFGESARDSLSLAEQQHRDAIIARAAVVTNALLAVLFFLGLFTAGARLHSVQVGATLTAVAAVFPGVQACLAQPEIMVPAVLIAWAAALLTCGALGALFSLFVLLVAGLAWSWAWLGVPILLAYCWRRRWAGLTATLGAALGLAATAVLIFVLVVPSVPQVDGALAAAGVMPRYQATLTNEGQLKVEPLDALIEPPASFPPRRWFWQHLLSYDDVTLADFGGQLIMPNGMSPSDIRYADITARGRARQTLSVKYAAAMAEENLLTRFAVRKRTLLESTWLAAPAEPEGVAGAWNYWATQPAPLGLSWDWIRRGVKIAVVLAAFLAAFVLYRRQAVAAPQLAGGLLLFGGLALLASWAGAVTGWVWLLPGIVVTLAAFRTPTRAAAAPQHPPPQHSSYPPAATGPAPRISVNN